MKESLAKTSMKTCMKCLVSGGQTGADRAALDWAIENNFPYSGWCPDGRLAEDGPLIEKYRLSETETSNYEERTRYNVQDSDGTVIFSFTAELSGGTLLTKYFANKANKPLLHLKSGQPDLVLRLKKFVRKNKIYTLNVAGPRASEEPYIYQFVLKVLDAAFG